MTNEGARRLAAAVLVRAALDVQGVKLSLWDYSTKEAVRASALAWLHSTEARSLAEQIDVDLSAGVGRLQRGGTG